MLTGQGTNNYPDIIWGYSQRTIFEVSSSPQPGAFLVPLWLCSRVNSSVSLNVQGDHPNLGFSRGVCVDRVVCVPLSLVLLSMLQDIDLSNNTWRVYFELIPASWQFQYTRKNLFANYRLYEQFAADAASGNLASYSTWLTWTSTWLTAAMFVAVLARTVIVIRPSVVALMC